MIHFVPQRVGAIIETDHGCVMDLADGPRHPWGVDSGPRVQAYRDSLIALRTALSGAFGADFGDKLLGVEGRTPDDSLA